MANCLHECIKQNVLLEHWQRLDSPCFCCLTTYGGLLRFTLQQACEIRLHTSHLEGQHDCGFLSVQSLREAKLRHDHDHECRHMLGACMRVSRAAPPDHPNLKRSGLQPSA